MSQVHYSGEAQILQSLKHPYVMEIICWHILEFEKKYNAKVDSLMINIQLEKVMRQEMRNVNRAVHERWARTCTWSMVQFFWAAPRIVDQLPDREWLYLKNFRLAVQEVL